MEMCVKIIFGPVDLRLTSHRIGRDNKAWALQFGA
jgi:hypothetical protein